MDAPLCAPAVNHRAALLSGQGLIVLMGAQELEQVLKSAIGLFEARLCVRSSLLPLAQFRLAAFS